MSEEKDIRPEEAEELEATPETQGGEDTAPEAETPPEEADGEVIEVNPLQPLLDEMQAQLVEKEDKLLRLAAEFDNFRRRSQKEKDGVWASPRSTLPAGPLTPMSTMRSCILRMRVLEKIPLPKSSRPGLCWGRRSFGLPW